MKIAPLFAPFLLAACGGGDASAEGERASAAGEVLGGTISDDMLPLDTATSQSPPLQETGDGDKGITESEPESPRDSDEGPGEPPRDPAPLAEPSAAETPEAEETAE